MKRRPNVRSAVIVAILTLAISACGGEDDSATSKPFNDADVEFVLRGGQHLTVTVTTAQTAVQRADAPAVRRLARRVIDTHGPGADEVAGWVLSWGKQGAAVGHDADVDHGSAEEGGFDDVTISRLSAADGARFDRLYLTALIEHLDNGAEIWRSESDDGTHEGATDLAASLRDVEAKLRSAAQRLID